MLSNKLTFSLVLSGNVGASLWQRQQWHSAVTLG